MVSTGKKTFHNSLLLCNLGGSSKISAAVCVSEEEVVGIHEEPIEAVQSPGELPPTGIWNLGGSSQQPSFEGSAASSEVSADTVIYRGETAEGGAP